MRVVRLHDPSRQPTDWMDLIQPGEVAAFPSLLDGAHPCDPTGAPTGHHAAVCLLFASLPLAEHHPAVCFDVFDHAGRSRPPLVTIAHPSHRARLEGNADIRRRSRWIVAALVTTSAGLSGPSGTRTRRSSGCQRCSRSTALVFAGRLLQLNAAYAGVDERTRRARHQRHAADHTPTSAGTLL